MDFIKRISHTKTFWLGVVLLGVSIAGLIPALGYGFQPEAMFAGLALMTVRDAIEKQDINRLDPLLDKVLGDANSAQIQEFLIALLVSKGVPEEEAAEIAQKATSQLEQ